MTTTNVHDTMVTFHIKSTGQDFENTFFNLQLPIDDIKTSDNMLNNEILNETKK